MGQVLLLPTSSKSTLINKVVTQKSEGPKPAETADGAAKHKEPCCETATRLCATVSKDATRKDSRGEEDACRTLARPNADLYMKLN